MAKKTDEKPRTYTGGQTRVAVSALAELSRNPMPIIRSVEIRRIVSAFREYAEPLEERIQESFRKHANGDRSLKPGTESREAFDKDIETYLLEEFEITFDPLPLSVVTSLGDDAMLSPLNLDILIQLGIVEE